ncbi:EamA family transporter [Corticibacter populi]|nr:putative membrane protein [Corticibacter populi]
MSETDLWIPVVLLAAAAQTVRNTAQRSLSNGLGTWPATLVRFLYGLPFAALFLLLLYVLPEQAPAWPNFSWTYVGWIAFGALFQVGATAALLLAMQSGNFAVAVTLSKTEVLQVVLFASIVLAELPTPLQLAGALLATLGVGLLSMPADRQHWHWSHWLSRSSLYGLLCGACFALATLGFRAGAVALDAASPWLSGAWGVTLAQALQSLLLGGWLFWSDRTGFMATLRSWRVSLLAGSMGALASLLWFSAYAMQTAGAVRALGMVEVLFGYLVSRRILHESLRRTERWGMALVALAAVLICVGL